MEGQFNDQHHLEAIQKSLESKDYVPPDVIPRTKLETKPVAVQPQWQPEPVKPPVNHSKLFKRILIGSILFFILAVGLAALIFFYNLNVVSADKVAVNVLGPVSVSAGDQLSFDVIIENDNTVAMQNAVMYIDYPDGTKNAQDITQDLIHEKDELGPIAVHATVRKTIKAVLYGEEQSDKKINITVEYGVSNSNAAFKKEKQYDVTISSAPLVLNISNPAEVASGDTVQFSVDVTSNASGPLSNLLLKVNYPFGFNFVSANPAPSFDNNDWLIGSLAPGEKKTITFKGTLEGQENDERAFQFQIGAQSQVNPKEIATAFLSSTQSVTLHRPLIGANLSVGGSTAKEYDVNQSGPILSSLTLTNNLPTKLLDTQVKVVFGGNALDPSSPSGDGSIYRLTDKTMTWDKNSSPSLAVINPGDNVNLNFNFSTLNQQILPTIHNGTITIAMTVTGNEIGTDSSVQPITVTINRTVKIQSAVGLSSQLFYTSGPFKNSGPVPPIVDKKTTYTVAWTLSNSSNILSNTEMKATLPAYVTWLGAVSPASERVTYDPSSKQVIWHPGDIAASARRPVSFQISVQPTVNQVGSAPAVVVGQAFTATDTFTGQAVQTSGQDLTTSLFADPNAINKDGTVKNR